MQLLSRRKKIVILGGGAAAWWRDHLEYKLGAITMSIIDGVAIFSCRRCVNHVGARPTARYSGIENYEKRK